MRQDTQYKNNMKKTIISLCLRQLDGNPLIQCFKSTME